MNGNGQPKTSWTTRVDTWLTLIALWTCGAMMIYTLIHVLIYLSKGGN